jgi:hypothetical protein
MKPHENTQSFSSESYVHKVFLLQRPTCTAYKRGWSLFDGQMGKCRDEQAWMVVLEYNTGEQRQENCQMAAIYLRPSVSKNELKKAMDVAIKAFPSYPNKGKRPPIHESDQELLRALWITAEKRAKKELAPRILVELAREFMNAAKRPLSASKIWSECRIWRIETGRKVKKAYVTENRERRSTKKTSN